MELTEVYFDDVDHPKKTDYFPKVHSLYLQKNKIDNVSGRTRVHTPINSESTIGFPNNTSIGLFQNKKNQQQNSVLWEI